MQYFELEINGQTKRIFAQRLTGSLWFHVDGQTYVLQEQTRRSATQGDSTGDGTILAPMPGKILKVNCSKGQAVKEGQLLVVMEAMKMEYSFAADFAGVVQEVTCKPGDQVAVGQTLVKVTKGS